MPRQSGPRRQPGAPPFRPHRTHTQAADPYAPSAVTDRPTGRPGPWQTRGLIGQPQTQSEMRFSGTVRGTQLRLPVGKCHISGGLFAWKLYGEYAYASFVLGCGPAASVSNIKVSGKLATTMVTEGIMPEAPSVQLGTSDQAAWSHATTLYGHALTLRGLVVVNCRFDRARLSEVGLPTVEADLSMKAWDPWAGTPGYTETENGVLYLYTYLTRNPWGPKLADAQLDLSGWSAARVLQDSQVGSKARWRVGGVVPAGDVEGAVQTLLRGIWCGMPFRDGKLTLVPLQDLSGEPSVTLTSQRVRRRRVPYSSRPSVVKVNYRDQGDESQERTAWAVLDDLVAGTLPWNCHEESPPLCNADDVAKRDAETILALSQETARYTATIQNAEHPEVLDVLPGQVVGLQRTGGSGWPSAINVRVESVDHGDTETRIGCSGYSAAVSVSTGTGLGTGVTPGTWAEDPPPSGDYDRVEILECDPFGEVQRISAFTWTAPALALKYRMEYQIQLSTGGPFVTWQAVEAAAGALTMATTGEVGALPFPPIYTLDQLVLVDKFTGASTVWTLDNLAQNFCNPIAPVSGEVIQYNGSIWTHVPNPALLKTGGALSGDVAWDNNKAAQGKTTGGTARNLAKVNGSDEVELGDANLPAVIKSSGSVDLGAADLETTGDLVAANTLAECDRTTKSTTLTSGAGVTFLKLPLDLDRAASCEVYWEVEARKSGAVEFISGNARFSVKRLSGGTTVTSVTEWGRDNGLAGNLSVALTSSNASLYEGRMQIVATTSTVGMTITLRARCLSGSPTQPVWNF